MVLNGIIVIDGVNFTEFHVIYTNAVISESLTMDITDCPANLQEFLVLLNGFFEFT